MFSMCHNNKLLIMDLYINNLKQNNSIKLKELELACANLIVQINEFQEEVDKQPSTGLHKFLGLLKGAFANLQFQINAVNIDYNLENRAEKRIS